jgi:hypothetical protein
VAVEHGLIGLEVGVDLLEEGRPALRALQLALALGLGEAPPGLAEHALLLVEQVLERAHEMDSPRRRVIFPTA